jgi:sugar transferase (PEP-CTERM system associated)
MIQEDLLLMYLRTVVITLMIYPLCFYVFDLYNIERFVRSWEIVYRGALAVMLSYVLVMFTQYLLITERPYGRVVLALQMILVWVFMTGWRWMYARISRTKIQKKRVLILGANQCGRTICDLLSSPLSGYDVVGFLDDDPTRIGLRNSPAILGTCDNLQVMAHETDADMAILAIPRNRSPELIRQILAARLNGIDVRDMADIYELITGRIPVHYIEDQWLLFAEGFYLLNQEYMQKLKRLMDLIISGIILLITAPLMALISIAIRLDSTGPVLFTQTRLGKQEKDFLILKFRTMCKDAETDGAKWASEMDPRVTRVGRWLRLTHIDELPQLWNVIKGDMSLIGPRPERPEFVTMLQKEIPYYFVRHSVRPGVTGWAQVNYRYGASVEDSWHKLECDLYYIKNMSFSLDLRIFLRTLGVILLADGAR